MIRILETQADLEAAMQSLAKADPRLSDIIALTGVPTLRRRIPGFAGLTGIIVSQQLSTASAAAIWGRLSGAFEPFHPETVCRARADRLGRLGLSAAKIRTLRAIGKDIAAGTLDLDALATRDADEAHAMLTAVHGIGPWTADIYLLFCLGHPDAWPAGDLALQEAIRIGFRLKTRPTAKEMVALAETWRPHRGAAAHLLWAYYKIAKSAGFEATVNDARNAAKAARKPKLTVPKAAKSAAAKPRVKAAARPPTTSRAPARLRNGR